MPRTLRISASLVIGFVLFASIAWVLLFNTEPGKTFLKQQILNSIQQMAEASSGSDVSIGRLDGNFPGQVTLTELSASADGVVWLEVEKIDLEWSPWAFLFQRRVVVSSLAVTGADLLALPARANSSSNKNVGFALPAELPWIEAKNMSIARFRVADGILGTNREYSFNGSFSTASNRVRSIITAASDDGNDNLSIVIATNRRELSVDVLVRSTETGSLAWILKEEKPLAFMVTGAGPLKNWSGEVVAQGGSYGDLDLRIEGNVGRQSDFSVYGQVTPGERLSPELRQATGEVLDLALSVRQQGDRYDLNIEKMAGYFGSLSGAVAGLQAPSKVEDVNLDLALTLSQPYASARKIPLFAGESEIAGTLSYKNQTITGSGKIETPVASIRIADMKHSKTDGLLADVEVSVETSPIRQKNVSALLKNGAHARATITLISGELRWRDLSAFTGRLIDDPELTIDGAGSFALKDRNLSYEGKIEVSPDLVSNLNSAIKFDDGVKAKIKLTGPVGKLKIDVASEYGPWMVGKNEFSAGRFDATLADVPVGLEGNIAIVGNADDHALSLDISTPTAGAFLFENISSRILGILVTGEVTSNTVTESIQASLGIVASEGATLPGGHKVQGSVAMDAEFGTRSSATQAITATLNANQLLINNVLAESLDLTIDGTSRQLNININGNNLSLPGDQFLARFDGDVQLVRSGEASTLIVDSFQAQTAASGGKGAIRLVAPANIVVQDSAISLGDTRIQYSSNTQLDLSGEYSRNRIVVKVIGENVQLPFLDAPLTFDLAVDTEAEEAGRATIAGTMIDQDGSRHDLQLLSIWDGSKLIADATLLNERNNVSGLLNVTCPLLLERGERLRVSTGDGVLDGRLTYDDTLLPLLAFLPFDTDLVAGDLTADVVIAGTVDRPNVNGGLKLSKGRYEERNTGALITEMVGSLDFAFSNDGSEGVFQLTAADAAGNQDTIEFTGSVFLGRQAGGDFSVVDGKLILERATLIKSSELTAEVTSDLDLTGSVSDLLLSGRIDIRKFDALIPSIKQKKKYVPVNIVRVDDSGELESGQEKMQKPKILSLALDLTVAAKDEILIAGRGLQSEWKGDVKITGTASNPTLRGSAESIRGSLDFAGRKFQITRGRIVFGAVAGRTAELDISAEYDATTTQGEVKAIVDVSGSSKNPSVKIRSIPSLPQDRVMALILFGKAPSELSAFESLRIAQAITELSGTGILGGEGITGAIRRIGLDALSFGRDETTGAGVVSVGKYVSEDIYVSATQGLGTKGAVSVTYDINDKVSIESTIEQDGAQSVSANYKRDY